MSKQTKKKSKKASSISKARLILWCVAVVCIILAAGATMFYSKVFKASYQGEDTRIYLPQGITANALRDTLRSNLGESFADKVYRIWQWRDGQPQRAEGSYLITPGITAVELGKRLVTGAQDPVKVTFNNVRTMQQLADKVTRHLAITPGEFLAACDSVLPAQGYSKAAFPAAFLPDTYEFYWNAKAPYIVRRLVDIRDKFWTAERRAKAESMHLTPEQVATVASIVEEESAKTDERPMIARLYLNRLDRGMKLQADPTVKFAVGDFSLRRILGKHLATPSPYNTYQNAGLPPGPIRIVERQTLDGVLNAPEHGYLYMCAKEDFSGYHNFAVTGAEHMANAERYHRALNARGIK